MSKFKVGDLVTLDEEAFAKGVKEKGWAPDSLKNYPDPPWTVMFVYICGGPSFQPLYRLKMGDSELDLWGVYILESVLKKSEDTH